MPKELVEIEIKKDNETRRAKHAHVSLNKKHGDFPQKAANISIENQQETSIALREINRTNLNQIGLLIRPKRLREIVSNPTTHQSLKDSIRRVVADAGKKSLNLVYPLLLNQRSQNESMDSFRPFPRPTEKIVQKIFDLFDIEGIDILVVPVVLDDKSELSWAQVSANIYAERKPDFLNEYIISGLIPNSVSEGTATKMATMYIENGFESLTFDFASQKVRESKMRGIIDSIPVWDELLVHGTNVPHYNWHGTFRSQTLPVYDLLVSVYGFDSFGSVMTGFADEPEGPESIPKKMRRKRYRMIETYGTYTKDGLETLLETHKSSCNCPICRKVGSPIDLYDRPKTNEGLKSLWYDLKIHRLHTTHKEIGKASKLIDKSKYHDHLVKKKVATNELQAMIGAIGPRGLDEWS